MIAFFIAYLTEGDLLSLHVWAGFTVGTLVVMRVLWAFVGPRHARVSDFLCGPTEMWRYLFALLAFRPKRYLGHSPAGGAMVLALLLGLAATVWSGLELYAVEENAGPLAQLSVDPKPASVLADEDTREREGEHEETGRRRDQESGQGEFWEEIHETLAHLVLALVLLHIARVLVSSAVPRENSVKPMVTGFKRAEQTAKKVVFFPQKTDRHWTGELQHCRPIPVLDPLPVDLKSAALQATRRALWLRRFQKGIAGA